MKKRLLLICFAIILCGCGSNTENEIISSEEHSEDYIVSEEFDTSEIVLQEVENLQDAQITLPIGIVGTEIEGKNVLEKEETPEDSEENNDVSSSTQVTYSISGEDRTQIVNELSAEVISTIDEILNNDELYPNIIKILPSEDCTVFDIYFSTKDICIYESMLTLPLYMLGDKYQLYYGIPSENVLTTLHYIDSTTNETFFTGTSDEMVAD